MRRPKPLLTTSLLAVVAALVVAAPAPAATPCWRLVINDWYGNGRVDGHYPIHCYTQAIAKLPEDSKQYSSAPEDIRRDMLLAIRGDSQGGPGNPISFGGGPGPSGGSSGGRSHSEGFLGGVFNRFGPKNATSIPLPLIVLAGVALLLLAAGAASFVARRIQARRVSFAPDRRRS